MDLVFYLNKPPAPWATMQPTYSLRPKKNSVLGLNLDIRYKFKPRSKFFLRTEGVSPTKMEV